MTLDTPAYDRYRNVPKPGQLVRYNQATCFLWSLSGNQLPEEGICLCGIHINPVAALIT
jgi:hypothetical protein